MAAPSGTRDPHVASSIIRTLLEREEACEFQFFQAVRLLERLLPERLPVGRFEHPSREVARFGAHPSMIFPASEIQRIDWSGEAPSVMVNFMGLTGPMGILPLYYTELMVERMRAKDHGIRHFFDIFNHRMISLFYQAWEKYRFTIAYERRERDSFSHSLLDFIGLGTPGLEDRQAVRDDSLLFYAGLFSLHSRSAAALRQILRDYFDVPVAIDQFIGAWYPIDEPNQCCFEEGNTYSEQVGFGAIVGDEIWDMNSGVRITLGPLTFRQYLDFLPNGSAYEPLKALTKFFVDGELDFEVRLVLKRDEVPGCELGATSDAAPQLGWCSWAKTRPMDRDPDDTILRM